MDGQIPDWAIERAVELANANGSAWCKETLVNWSAGKAFARYIAEHEEPPISPFDAAFDEIYNDGTLRTNADVIKAALKRGMELAREGGAK